MPFFRIGELVVVNKLPDATLYRVKDVGDRMIGVIDSEIEEQRPNQTVQWLDATCFRRPTTAQLKRQ